LDAWLPVLFPAPVDGISLAAEFHQDAPPLRLCIAVVAPRACGDAAGLQGKGEIAID
jgi:hypothetical protein